MTSSPIDAGTPFKPVITSVAGDISELRPIPLNSVYDLLRVVDRWSTDAQHDTVMLMEPSFPEVGNTHFDLVAMIRLLRISDSDLVTLCFQRLLSRSPTVVGPSSWDDYAPARLYEESIAHVLGDRVRKGANWFRLTLFDSPTHVLFAWALHFSGGTARPKEYLEMAAGLLEKVEGIFSSRLAYIDVTDPSGASAMLDEGRAISDIEKRFLLETYGLTVRRGLHRGGVATLWLVGQDGVQSALKLLAPDFRFRDLDRLRERFSREFRIGQKLNALGVSPAVSLKGDLLGRPFFIQEYLDWPSLREWLGSHPDYATRERVIRNLLSATSRMHKKGVIHRDLSPKNILIGPDFGVRIVDFGGARSIESEEDNDFTLPDEQIGSLKYTAPECRDDPRSATRSSDVFSLGIIAYEIMLHRNIAGSMPPLAGFGVRVSDRLSEFAHRAISFLPDERPNLEDLSNR